MQYLTYDEYIKIGGVCDEPSFNRYITRACSVIDNATYGRISAMKDIPQNVKACCRDILEYFVANVKTYEKDVASWSESAGGVSESVTYATKTNDDIEHFVNNIIKDYLFSVQDDNGTPLMYKGAMF